MTYDGNVTLDTHDKEHLTDCFPRPASNPYKLTTPCEFTGGGGGCGGAGQAPCP